MVRSVKVVLAMHWCLSATNKHAEHTDVESVSRHADKRHYLPHSCVVATGCSE